MKKIAIGLVVAVLFIIGLVAEPDNTVQAEKKQDKITAVTEIKDQNILITASDVIRVSDFEYTLADKQAVSIAFGESDSRWCDVTINRENVYEGYYVISNRRQNYKEISFDCNWDSALFVLNGNIDTNVKFELISLDHKNKIAKAVISAKLHEVTKASENRFGSIARLMAVEITITGQHFDNLIKQM